MIDSKNSKVLHL